ncbi:FSD1-like protein [Gouania willdenowi]|uniref:FSD1-like protein n=1 Tax=Gouania willdenowi TaxID=441366 RepID=UPI0010550C0B|nr:FSD1-like protein [Gouania willdenowi]
MEAQKEALRRIMGTVSCKKAELQGFVDWLGVSLNNLQEESCRVMSELEEELEQLRVILEEKGAELHRIIEEERQRKEAELQTQLSASRSALTSCEDLLQFSNHALTISRDDDFLTAAKEIKERVTMAAAFRMSMRPCVSENMSKFTVDFSAERAGLQQLHFLPVPATPLLESSDCVIRDNNIQLSWRLLLNDEVMGESNHSYELEYRKSDSSTLTGSEASWERISNIQEAKVTIRDLKFDSRYVLVRVRAKNKAAAGEFCEPVAVETRAFTFGLDATTAHSELKVEGGVVSWQPQVKGHDPRQRAKDPRSSSRSSTPSPNQIAAGRIGRERFAGESYTVLGDREIKDSCHYWEIRPIRDWKSLSVGVAYRASLGRFDQLGKSSGSWCLHASQWLHSLLSAKHNNKAKALDWPIPQRIGIYCDYDNGDLLFIDVDHLHLLHSFKTKFNQPLVPAFTVWCGGISLATGLQVPSFIDNLLPANQSPSQ